MRGRASERYRRAALCALAIAFALPAAAPGQEFVLRPDLVVDALRVGKPRVIGRELKIVAELRNIGTADAPPFSLAWEVDGQPFGKERISEGLGTGEVVRRTLLYTAPTTGFHHVAVAIDPDGEVEESDASNNDRRQVQVWMRPVSERTRPDLVVGEFSLSESRVSGHPLRVTFGVGNIGRATDRELEVVVELDGLPEYRVSVPPLAPGELQLLGTRLLSPTPGEHTVEVIVDPRQRFVEVDDGNNSVGTSGTPRVPSREEFEELRRLQREQIQRSKRRRKIRDRMR